MSQTIMADDLDAEYAFLCECEPDPSDDEEGNPSYDIELREDGFAGEPRVTRRQTRQAVAVARAADLADMAEAADTDMTAGETDTEDEYKADDDASVDECEYTTDDEDEYKMDDGLDDDIAFLCESEPEPSDDEEGDPSYDSSSGVSVDVIVPEPPVTRSQTRQAVAVARAADLADMAEAADTDMAAEGDDTDMAAEGDDEDEYKIDDDDDDDDDDDAFLCDSDPEPSDDEESDPSYHSELSEDGWTGEAPVTRRQTRQAVAVAGAADLAMCTVHHVSVCCE